MKHDFQRLGVSQLQLVWWPAGGMFVHSLLLTASSIVTYTGSQLSCSQYEIIEVFRSSINSFFLSFFFLSFFSFFVSLNIHSFLLCFFAWFIFKICLSKLYIPPILLLFDAHKGLSLYLLNDCFSRGDKSSL